MKVDKTQIIKTIIAIGLMAFTLGLGFYWVKYGQQKFVYKTVVVASEDIQKGTIITDNMLKFSKVDDSNRIKNAITMKSDITNLASKQYIPANAQIKKEFLDEPKFVLKNKEFVFKVPSDWIYAVPSSIRRRDTSYFYIFDSKIEQSLKASTKQEVITPSYTIKNYNINAVKDMLTSLSASNFVLKATVAYVKDNANREVVSINKDERLDGSSQFASLEIIATEEDVKLLEDAVKNGFKFLVLYN